MDASKRASWECDGGAEFPPDVLAIGASGEMALQVVETEFHFLCAVVEVVSSSTELNNLIPDLLDFGNKSRIAAVTGQKVLGCCIRQKSGMNSSFRGIRRRRGLRALVALRISQCFDLGLGGSFWSFDHGGRYFTDIGRCGWRRCG